MITKINRQVYSITLDPNENLNVYKYVTWE